MQPADAVWDAATGIFENMNAVDTRMTTAEYLERDGQRYTELLDGEMIVSKPRGLATASGFSLVIAELCSI